jgi:radical SAM superfamily enzyme YgiQ (UPF0313 family)
MNGLALPAADGGSDLADGGVEPAPHGRAAWCGALTRLEVVLVRPAKYDDDGYVLRHRWGVLPSNTLACLASLTEDVDRRGALRPLRLRTHTYDESVERLPMRRLRRLARREDTKVVVCLVGVQTSQFPRAADLALRLRGLGIDVLIGGFHVSGLLTHSSALPAHLRELADAGVILVRGEVEDVWQDILGHVVAGTMPPIYDRGAVTPDLRTAPVPRLAPRALRRFAFRHFGTVDTSRGCPFTCSFCAIIAVQGQAMRARDAEAIAGAIAASHTATGTRHYFLTDDDFARNREWRRVFEALIRLRETRGIGVRFLMQVDALAHRTPDFVALAQAAGCFQVFIGLESLNPRNLAAATKRQNRVGDFAAMIAAWRAAGILIHAGYIIGFPDDTADSVRADVAALRDDVRPDVASFFMLTPLAGSADYARLLGSGAMLDDDLNRHDTFHPVLDHPRMSRAAWYAAYRQAWADFYTDDVMRQRLRDARGEQHITLLQIYFWYLASTVVEDFHPMMTGFLRLKPRADRRPGAPVDGRLRHALRRTAELRRHLAGYAQVARRLQRLWCETRAGASGANTLRDQAGFLRAMLGPTAK